MIISTPELDSMGGFALFASQALALVVEHEMLQEVGEMVGLQEVVVVVGK